VDADYNGARNVLKRYDDPDIGLFTSKEEVRRIVEGRSRTAETVPPGLEKLVSRASQSKSETAFYMSR
jgi:hypothetical protein